MNATDHEHEIDTDALNALLRGETAAVETYTHALGQFDDPAVIADLQKIRDEHSRAVRELRDHVVALGGRPVEGGGPWGTSTAAATTAAKALGAATVLAALRQGEEYGISEYEGALDNGHIPPECLRTIRADLMAACRRHIDELNRLLGGMSN